MTFLFTVDHFYELKPLDVFLLLAAGISAPREKASRPEVKHLQSSCYKKVNYSLRLLYIDRVFAREANNFL